MIKISPRRNEYEPVPGRIESAFCSLPWTRCKIQCNGYVNVCCHQTFKYIGNLFEESLEDIWFGPIATAIRHETLNDRLHPNCQTSECPFMYIKKARRDFYVNKSGFPAELEFDLHASHCNFGGIHADPRSTCIMCPRAAPGMADFLKTSEDRTFELLDKVKCLMPHLSKMCVMGLAEPFWKGKLFDVFDALDFNKHSDRIFFWTNSNASLFDREMQERYAKYVKLGCLQFSLDAATSETFQKIRKNNVFERCCENIRTWSQYRKAINQQGINHTCNIANNINRLNIEELPAMVVLAKELGVDSLLVSPTHNMGGLNTPLNEIMPNEQTCNLFHTTEAAAIKLAKSIGFPLYITRPLDYGLSDLKLVPLTRYSPPGG